MFTADPQFGCMKFSYLNHSVPELLKFPKSPNNDFSILEPVRYSGNIPDTYTAMCLLRLL